MRCTTSVRPQAGPDQEIRERLKLLKTLELVVLDDLGAEKNTDWVTERLYVIINARYNKMLPTIITSNLELEELEKLPGWDRIVSRLIEMCHLVKVDGVDYRKGGLPNEGTAETRKDRKAAGKNR